jgi:hypothetical protein
MAHGNLKRRSGDMGSLEFMNQDGDWEKFPTDEEIAIMRSMMNTETLAKSVPPIHPEITTVCHLCNEPFPMEDVVITGGSLLTGYTWSCPKCHAITSLGKA